MFETLPKTSDEVMDWGVDQYKPYYEDLLQRPLTAENVEQWLLDWSRLSDLTWESYARMSLATSQDVTDEAAKKRFFTFLETIFPETQRQNNALQRKLLESKLEPPGFEMTLRYMRQEAELFREANLPLLTEEQKLGKEYDEIAGAQTVNWDGEEKTLQQLQPFGQHPDRNVREQVWRLAHQRFLRDRPKFNELWVKLLDLRTRIAANAGYSSYVDFRFKDMARFDYTPDDCARFHAAIEEVVVPVAARLNEHRRQLLGVPSLRPWDMNIDPTHPNTVVLDPRGRAPLKPYQSVQEMDGIAAQIFRNVDPVLGDYYTTMQREALLDLGNRKNKAPGGYCTSFPVRKRPFIFMNAVGLHDDVQTLLHESGHAFHVFEAADLKYSMQRGSPIEFAEVASMGMELLAGPYLTKAKGGYYSEADAARARIEHLENMINFWPYMAVVDAFQLWAYRNVEAARDPANCDRKWGELWDRFIKGVDWSGLDDEKVTGWHRKLHIFQYAFYYVEYGLAQLGAAQVWRGSLNDQAGAVARYRAALALGSTVPLPKLFETAGAKFAFDAETLRSAVDLIEKTINELNAVAG